MDSTKLLSLLKEASITDVTVHPKGGSVKIGTKNKSVEVDMDFSKTTKSTSIKNQARKSIAQFPVLVSENLNPSLTPIMLNAIEAKNALYLAMLIQNTRSFNSQNVTGIIGTFIKENAELSERVFLEGCDSVRALCEANAELLLPYEDSFNRRTINESYYSKSLMYYLEAQGNSDKEQRDKEKHSWGRDAEARNKRKEKIDAEERDRKHRREDEKDAQDQADRDRDAYERRAKNGVANVLTQPKDLVKQNDLQPLILRTEVNFTDEATQAVIKREIMIGVKSVGHLVKSKDIVYYLVKSAYKNNFFLKLIKWTTGEISFFKDLLFTLDDIKTDVKISANNGSNKNPFYTLSMLAKQSRGSGLKGSKDLPTRITTLILTKTDIENIKYKDGINILANPEYLKKIQEAYHLMDIYIVDESLDVVYSYDDQSHTIERIPFTSFEKQSKERKVNANDLYKLFK